MRAVALLALAGCCALAVEPEVTVPAVEALPPVEVPPAVEVPAPVVEVSGVPEHAPAAITDPAGPAPAVLPPAPPLRDAADDRNAVRKLVVLAARQIADGDLAALAAQATSDALLPSVGIPALALMQEGEPRLDGDHAAWGGAAIAGPLSGRWHGSAVHTADGWRLTRLAVTLDPGPAPTPPAPLPWGWLTAGGILGLALGAVIGVILAKRR